MSRFAVVLMTAWAGLLPGLSCRPAWEAPSAFARAEVVEDLSRLVEAFEDVHPNLYHTISREEFLAERDALVARLPAQIGQRELTLELLELTARIGEGHTGVRVPGELHDVYRRRSAVFPLVGSAFVDGGLVVERDLSPAASVPAGARVVNVNGVEIAQIRERGRGWLGGIPAYRDARLARELAFWLDMMELRAPFRVKWVAEGGVVRDVELAGVVPRLVSEAVSVRIPEEEYYRYRVIDESLAYIDFRKMRDPERFEDFLEQTFRDIRRRELEGVIVDLRQNQGGSSLLGNALLSYVTDKPYRFAGGVEWKVSQTYKDFFVAQGERYRELFGEEATEHYLGAENGSRIVYEAGEPKPPDDNPLRFNGPTVFLIGPLTFSSANMLANGIKDYGLATLIGQSTGEPPNDFGETCNIELPRTGITVYSSSKAYIRANGDREDREPIHPDVAVAPGAGDGDEDAALAAAVEWIRGR